MNPFLLSLICYTIPLICKGTIGNKALTIQVGFLLGIDLIENIDQILRSKECCCILRGAIVTHVSARAHNDDLVTQGQCQGRVRNQNDRLSLPADFSKRLHQMALRSRIQSRCRLIKEEQIRVAEHFNRNAGSLFLSPAYLFQRRISRP